MKPMMAETGSHHILSNKEYIFEPKLDGFRVLVDIKKNKMRFFNRSGKDVTSAFSHLDFSWNVKKPAVIDGELIVYNQQGNPDFSLMMESYKYKQIPPTYVVFDVLEVDGKKVTSKPLLERKNILKQIIRQDSRVQLMVYTTKGKKLWDVIRKREGEGIIAKKKLSPYVQERSKDWLKIKPLRSLDAVIIGYSINKKSLALGLQNKHQWIHIGNVGSGLTDNEYQDLIKTLKPQKKKIQLPFIQQIKPTLVCEVQYMQITKGNKLRAPVFVRVRKDKRPVECTTAQLI